MQRGELDTPAIASVIQFVPSLPHALTYAEMRRPPLGLGECGPQLNRGTMLPVNRIWEEGETNGFALFPWMVAHVLTQL